MATESSRNVEICQRNPKKSLKHNLPTFIYLFEANNMGHFSLFFALFLILLTHYTYIYVMVF